MVKLGRRVVVLSTTVGLAAAGAVFVAPTVASAHGAAMMPGSRTYLCYKDAVENNGAAIPKNPACAAAVAQSGVNSIYNWFAVLRSNGAGQTTGFIPDGQLCSGGTGGPYDFTGYNLARDDWPVTHLTAGKTIEIDYNNWAKHPGTFYFYVTKDGFDPTKPLAWSDLESTPFSQVTDPAQSGGPGTDLGHYYWNATLPNKTGRHIIYSRWVRSDSQENFFGCSDVVFDGGNGQVTGLGSGSGSGSSSSSSSRSSSSSSSRGTSSSSSSRSTTTSSTSSSSGGTGSRGCTATGKITSSWSNGYQLDVAVTNSGASSIGSWSVAVSMPSGQTLNQVWNGTLSNAGSNPTVRNATWNGSVGAGASVSFGALVSGGSSSGTPTFTCTAG